jgi:hypothetical protein
MVDTMVIIFGRSIDKCVAAELSPVSAPRLDSARKSFKYIFRGRIAFPE